LDKPSHLPATVVSNAGIPPGTITFQDETNVLATIPLDNGTARFTSSISSKGTHKISAAYGGAANYFGSSSSLSEIEY
jgi:lipoprotein-anchoring transpeptidase ErfK/SrfK